MATNSTDEGYELLPPGIEPLEADAELALQDALAGGTSDPLLVQADTPPPLGRAPAYDFIGRLFIPGQAGGPLQITGAATLAQWIEKALRTRLGENPACDPGFGVRLLPADLLDGGELDEGAIAEASEDWKRAIQSHPRVSAVENFRIEGADGTDHVFVTMTARAEGLGDEGLVIDRLALPAAG